MRQTFGKRGATSMEYVFLAVLVSLAVFALASVSNSVSPGLTVASCMAEGGDPEACGMARTGAKCKDGSSSGATGRGACSRHGGVAAWTY